MTQVPMIDLPATEAARRILGSLQAGKQPLPLAGVRLHAKVVDRVAEVSVEQKFTNPLTEAIEAVYVFPLAGGCAVSRFEIQIGRRTVKARIEERGEARRQYDEALQAGKRAALLEQERDDVFTVQVGNLTPGDEITARLTYSERLPFFEDGRCELRLPLVVAPRYVAGEELNAQPAGHGTAADTDKVPDASRITPPRLAPGFDPQTALSIEAELFGGANELECSQHAVRSSAGPEAVTVSLSREREPLNRDFVLRWKLAGAKVQPHLLVHGEYAMVSLLPPAREGFLGTARDVVFVLDRSGSMQGPKMASASRACALLLRTLGPRDRFAALAFDDVVEWMPGGFVIADEAGIDKGEKWLRGIFSRGGTELDGAMAEALRQLKQSECRAPVLILLTDGQIGDESSVLKRIQTQLGGARVFTVGIDTALNDGFLKRLAALGGGTSTSVEPGARLEEALTSIGREIGTPLITDVQVRGELSVATPSRMPDLFAGRAASAFFRWHGGKVSVTGRYADGGKWQAELEPVQAPLAAIDHLWARARIMDLEDDFRATQSAKAKQEIIALSVKHTVLTRFTAFVAVDDEVVNKQGKPRTVVQPVEMPAEWAPMPQMTMAAGRMITMAGGAPAGAPPPMAPVAARSRNVVGGALKAMMHFGRGRGASDRVEDARHEPSVTPAERERVRKALEAFLEAFADARKLSGPPARLAETRRDLLDALAQALAIATAVPLLQAFLRSSAVELIAALEAGSADAPLFDRLAPKLEAARDEARAALSNGKPPAGRFWEKSI
ncbi:MAG TPA: VIT domain-containing protein [Myxococcales bacterium]|nr:VIT domain-containing protein [Myxococcales bacterium]